MASTKTFTHGDFVQVNGFGPVRYQGRRATVIEQVNLGNGRVGYALDFSPRKATPLVVTPRAIRLVS